MICRTRYSRKVLYLGPFLCLVHSAPWIRMQSSKISVNAFLYIPHLTEKCFQGSSYVQASTPKLVYIYTLCFIPFTIIFLLCSQINDKLTFHLENQGVDFLQFAFRWVNCLLLREFPFQLIPRLWDTYVAEAGGTRFSDFLVTIQLIMV